jgi:hypothetical protein
MTDDEFAAVLDRVIAATGRERYRILTSNSHPNRQFYRDQVIRHDARSTSVSTSVLAALTYQAEQDRFESLVLSCPYRDPLEVQSSFAFPSKPVSPDVRPCGCTARCHRGRGRIEDGLVGHHICLQCVGGL